MSVLYLLLPLALLLGAGAVGVFVVALRRGQFDDLETPPRRMLLDDERGVVGPPDPRRRAVAADAER
ncbi:MAG: cbb3-type cytochrome oxidase assembly protein CcoS [Proteobacteria bacterium]|jgi:cbb3-type cytochrome oxidase maturation protein|nr:cbb3-type cytochrome oxidase assembly protein CcoS [Pseudomonadota bacterium]